MLTGNNWTACKLPMQPPACHAVQLCSWAQSLQPAGGCPRAQGAGVIWPDASPPEEDGYGSLISLDWLSYCVARSGGLVEKPVRCL